MPYSEKNNYYFKGSSEKVDDYRKKILLTTPKIGNFL
jgi:hypothetical protein